MIKTYLTISIILLICHNLFASNANEKKVVVHADVPWEMTDVITKDNSVLSWSVKKNDSWSFNRDIFPDGHDANGIEGIPALLGYVFPGENLGKLIGRIGDSVKIFPMGMEGEIYIGQGEGANYLYLTINDEISRIYGKGFKDNEGELLVTIVQERQLTLNIQLICYEKCPSCKFAFATLQDVIKEENIKENIVLVKLENEQEAKNLRFVGSPTIRINYKDIDPSFEESAKFSLGARSYSYDGKVTGWPNKDMIKKAIERARKEMQSRNRNY